MERRTYFPDRIQQFVVDTHTDFLINRCFSFIEQHQLDSVYRFALSACEKEFFAVCFARGRIQQEIIRMPQFLRRQPMHTVFLQYKMPLLYQLDSIVHTMQEEMILSGHVYSVAIQQAAEEVVRIGYGYFGLGRRLSITEEYTMTQQIKAYLPTYDKNVCRLLDQEQERQQKRLQRRYSCNRPGVLHINSSRFNLG